VASAQDSEPADGPAPNTVTGTIEMVDEDGQTRYQLRVGDQLLDLSFGPSWFNDLAALFEVEIRDGDVVKIGGNVRSMSPNENASDTAKEKASQTLKIKTFQDQQRPKGKPAWAGGPEEQGAAHPGYEGRSKGQANKQANKPAKPEKPANAVRPDKPGNGPKASRQED